MERLGKRIPGVRTYRVVPTLYILSICLSPRSTPLQADARPDQHGGLPVVQVCAFQPRAAPVLTAVSDFVPSLRLASPQPCTMSRTLPPSAI
jgi:hypothetical protein